MAQATSFAVLTFPTMHCGPFELVEHLATGGMAEVWRASHRGTPVVMKFLSLEHPGARMMFADELRAHARLQHPHILQVLDFGTTQQDIARGPVKNTPWIALEYASGGELTRLAQGLSWSGIRVVLLSVLDALAHAHAHGVIHRDLKPANILLSAPNDARPGLKLADFGLAHLRKAGRTVELEGVSGTASSMAPEQCRGAFREFGPWTDLYAVGCLAYWLATREWPFGSDGTSSLIGHMRRAPPQMTVVRPVPSGFEAWVRRLLAKAPEDRPPCAAHAIHDFLALEPLEPSEPIPSLLLPSYAQVRATYGAPDASAMPTTWRRPAMPPPDFPLADAGMRLFPIRTWDTSGREAELDTLWAHLHQTKETARPGATLLTGLGGSGVSHLGGFFARRCASLGAAHVFTTAAFPDEDPGAPLVRLIADTLNAHGLLGEALGRTLTANLHHHRQHDPLLSDLLRQLLSGTVRDARVRDGAVTRVISTRDPALPTLVWIDDAHLSTTISQFVMKIMDNPTIGAVHFLLGMGEGSSSVSALEAHNGVKQVVLGPLTQHELLRMVQQALPLESGLAAQLVDEANGLPGPIVSALERLVQTEALLGTPHGFELVHKGDPTEATLIGDLVGLGVGDVIEPLGPDAMEPLVRAAVLGGHVTHVAWARVCDDPKGEGDPRSIQLVKTLGRHALLERLKELGLAIDSSDGWRFANHEFRRAVIQAGAVRGHWIGAEQAVATYLQALDPSAHALRIARHLQRAGALEEALDAALHSVVEPSGDTRLAGCELARQILTSMAVPEDDPRHDMVRGWRLASLPPSRHQEAIALANQMIGTSSGGRSSALLGLSLAELARQAAPYTERTKTRERAMAALQVLEPLEPTPLTLQGRIAVGTALKYVGDNHAAITVLDAVVTDARAGQHQRIFSHAWGLLAGARVTQNPQMDIDEAESRAEDLFQAGEVFEATTLLVLASHVALTRQEYPRARALCERDLALRRLISRNPSATLQNLVHVHVALGEPQAIRRALDALILQSPAGFFEAQIALARFCWAAVTTDTALARAELDQLLAAMSTPSFREDRLDAALLRLAADHLRAAQPELAAAVDSLAYRWIPS